MQVCLQHSYFIVMTNDMVSEVPNETKRLKSRRSIISHLDPHRFNHKDTAGAGMGCSHIIRAAGHVMVCKAPDP